MSTQPYMPQPGTPAPSRAVKFTPTQGLAEIVAISAIPGETAPSQLGAPEVKFRLMDGRIWYVVPVVADEIYRMRIAPRQQFEVLKYGRMKHELRITPLDAHLGGAGTAPTVPVPNNNNNYTSPNYPPPPPPIEWPREEQAPQPVQPIAATPAQPTKQLTGAAACMMSSMCAAVDAAVETQAYAARKGLGLTFSEESIRAIGLSIYIDACRNGGNR